MQANEYQTWALTKRKDYAQLVLDLDEKELVVGAMGLVGESGEFADLVKKIVFHRHLPDKIKLIHELGDVLWYVADIASTLDVTLEDVMMLNRAKLDTRYKDGFSTQASINRVDINKEN